METLKVLRVTEQAESCWKSFKERVLTRKTARDNLLLNTEFNFILKTLLCEGNGQAKEIALNFVLNCLKSKIISPTALITLIQQKMPPANSPKIVSMPLIERAASFLLEFEKDTGNSLILQLASNDPRIIPFVIDKLLAMMPLDVSSDFINFLLGDPDLIYTSSILEDPHYKVSRCRLLSHLVANVGNVEYADLLMTYLVWNSNNQCVLELGFISHLHSFFASSLEKLHEIHFELFDVFVETLCNSYFKFGSFGDTIALICESCSGIINDYNAFKIGSLLLSASNYNSYFASAVLSLLGQFDQMNSFAKVSCARIMTRLNIDREMAELMKQFFIIKEETFPVIPDEIISKPFTEFGILVHLGYQGVRPPNTLDNSNYFDLVEIAKGLDRFDELNIEKYICSGHFEVIFALLVFKWNTDERTDEVVKGFLRLVGNANEAEDVEAKILRYSWVVDFFETNFTNELYLHYLPLICGFVTSSDNVVFAFVKQKISLFLSQQKGNVSVQLPVISSLLALFESSQSRQSRLNFLTSMTLSFLHYFVSRNYEQVDTKAVFLAFKLLKRLSEIIVIDPRDIWTKYIELILKDAIMFENNHVRGAIFSFASSFRILPEGKTFATNIIIIYIILDADGELNPIKFAAVKLLIENLSVEKDTFALDQICESLSQFNQEILRKVQVKLLTPEPIEGEDQNEIRMEDLLAKSFIFNPELLYKISERYCAAGPSLKYKTLWTRSIDEEVEMMPRTKFLGSNEKTSPTKPSETRTKAVVNPSFCNPLICDSFCDVEFTNVEDVLKCLRSRLVPLIPSTSTLLWYVRPHLAVWLQGATERIFKQIDDQRIKKQLCDYEFLLKILKTGSSPLALSSLLLLISSIMKTGFVNQIISENYLFTSWINFMTRKLDEITEFKPLFANEEFMTAFAISASVLAGCSAEIDAVLQRSLETLILQNPKFKDGVAVFSAVEASSRLSASKVSALLLDKSISSKRRLVALLALLRLGHSNPGVVVISDKADEIELIIESISKRGLGTKTVFVDPIEFKGLSSYVQCLHSPEEVRAKAESRAFDCGSIPAFLKYDAIFSFLLGSGLDLVNLSVSGREIDFRGLEGSTKDTKCHALLQLLTLSSAETKASSTQNTSEGFERFGSASWLKFVGSLPSNNFKFDVLADCKLLPRITWPSIVPFDFALKHVLSITPITKVPFINTSILPNFLDSVMKFIKTTNQDNIKKIIEVLYSNSDDKSTLILFELLDYSIETEDCDDLLEIILAESLNYSQNVLKTFPFAKLNQMSPERLVRHSKLFKMLFDKLNLENSLIFEIKEDASNVFKELKRILDQDDAILLTVFIIKIRKMTGQARITASVSIIDLMFIYQQDEVKFERLSKLLHEILIDMELILLESKKCFSDQEIVNKFKSRSPVIPKDIFDQFESAISAAQFDKLSF